MTVEVAKLKRTMTVISTASMIKAAAPNRSNSASSLRVIRPLGRNPVPVDFEQLAVNARRPTPQRSLKQVARRIEAGSSRTSIPQAARSNNGNGNTAAGAFDGPPTFAKFLDPDSSGTPTYILPGVTISMIARGSGLPISTVSRVFTANPSSQRTPKTATLGRIARYLQLDYDEAAKLIMSWQAGVPPTVYGPTAGREQELSGAAI